MTQLTKYPISAKLVLRGKSMYTVNKVFIKNGVYRFNVESPTGAIIGFYTDINYARQIARNLSFVYKMQAGKQITKGIKDA